MEDEQLEVQEEEQLQVEDQAESTEADSAKAEVEAKAKRMGWQPKEKFKGDESRWSDADTFLKRAEEQLPLAVSNLKRLNEKLAEQERKDAEKDRRLDELAGTFKEFSEYHKASVKRAEEKAYQKARQELKEQQRQAVSDGDTDKFEQLDQKLEELETKKPVVEEPRKTETPQPKPDSGQKSPAWLEWEARNPWYGKDEAMSIVAAAASNTVAARFPHLINTPDIFTEYDKELRRLMPEKFTNPRRGESGAVSGGSDSVPSGGSGNSAPRKKTFNDLPADAKTWCLKYEKEGLLTKEQYLKEYPW